MPDCRIGATAVRLIAVGRLRAGPEAELFARYNARLRPPLAVTEVAEGRGAPAEIKRREAEALLAAIPRQRLGRRAGQRRAWRRTAPRWPVLLERWLGASRPLYFLLGGAEGLDAHGAGPGGRGALAGDRMTWPHLLVRPMLAEQLFRARAIATGHPYHRAGRP